MQARLLQVLLDRPAGLTRLEGEALLWGNAPPVNAGWLWWNMTRALRRHLGPLGYTIHVEYGSRVVPATYLLRRKAPPAATGEA